MIGLVLCGGQSLRMGTDKGLLLSQTVNWAQLASDKLRQLNIPVKISVNLQQLPAYKEALPGMELITDNVTLAVRGPLSGLLSAHIAYPSEDIFVLACDLPLMEDSLLKELNKQYPLRNAEALVYTNGGEPEPLCGIYTANGLKKAFTLLQQGALKKFSMKYVLDHIETGFTPLEEDQKKYFRNFNAHADLNGL